MEHLPCCLSARSSGCLRESQLISGVASRAPPSSTTMSQGPVSVTTINDNKTSWRMRETKSRGADSRIMETKTDCGDR
jgi:hypothetical protein